MESEEVMYDEDFDDGSDDGDPDFDFQSEQQYITTSTGSDLIATAFPSPLLADNSDSPHNQLSFLSSALTGNVPLNSPYSSNTGGKPSNVKRGPGRPRKDFMGIKIFKDNKVMKKFRTSTFVRNTSSASSSAFGQNFSSLLSKKKTFARDDILHLNTQDSMLSYPMVLPSPNDDYSNMSLASSLDTDIAEKLMQPPEEPIYFTEKYPGKLCALCNLPERSQLGQGDMLRIEVNSGEKKINTPLSSPIDGKESSSLLADDKSPRNINAPQLSNRRQKGHNKCKNPVLTVEYVDELEKVGYTEAVEFASLHDTGYLYLHRACGMWSFGIAKENLYNFGSVGIVVSQSLTRKCFFCSRLGASVSCKMSCPKYYHFPCVAASGAFQIMQSHTIFCRDHLGQVPLVCIEDINCRSCAGLGDVSNLMMCTVCGDHYHGSCIGVAQLPNVRGGWQCTSCRICQICRVPDMAEGRSLACEQCDKVYHASCLRPVMTSIPKFGWKCRCCRVCSDCGSRTPGAGTSSRWHNHYTVCDSCYQQRNKGFSCPVCHRAYRAAAHREMVKCSVCNKFVHSACDSDAELSVYHAKKELNPDYEYLCVPCKNLAQSGRINVALRRSSAVEDDSMSASQESCFEEMEVESVEKVVSDVGLGKGKPLAAIKGAKKRFGILPSQIGRPKGTGKIGFQKRFKLSDYGRKRPPKTKMRGIFGVPGVGLQKPASSESSDKQEEEPGIENRLVLCSAKDKFVLTQDICVMCGAIGTDQEGCLISCVQCGQCYHPYCVVVKVTKVILQKGWRCLDCTVCEGCGHRNDEALLILCDDCDISYHIYCMDPPLAYVPHGNWKCKWCAICVKCGTNDPGFNSGWMNSYSECGPCSSQSSCPVCSESYADNELIIQCTHCDRWLHCNCDFIRNEDDAEKCAEDGYTCVLCRPKDVPPAHRQPKKLLAIQQAEVGKPIVTPPQQQLIKTSPEENDYGVILGLDGNHYMDGVCLSEHGQRQIKALQLEHNKKKRRPKINLEPNAVADKEAGILAAIESVVAGSSLDNSLEDIKFEPLDPKEEAEIYRDGMVWDRDDASPPEGFTLCTTENGVVVLRKRRQRNLQKLGIGGFAVRNRTVKSGVNTTAKEDAEDDSIFPTSVPNITSENNMSNDKKKKPIRKKQKNKLIETYPSYLQEAFFGKGLLHAKKAVTKFELNSEDDEPAKPNVSDDKTIKLSLEELKMIEAMREKQQKQNVTVSSAENIKMDNVLKVPKVEVSEILTPKKEKIGDLVDAVNDSDTDALKDILPGDLLDNDLVNTIMNENEDLGKNADDLVRLATADSNDFDDDNRTKNDLNDILNTDFNYVMDSKDVEAIFKVVLTDESHGGDEESQESLLANTFSSPQNQVVQQQQQQQQPNILSPQANIMPPQQQQQQQFHQQPQQVQQQQQVQQSCLQTQMQHNNPGQNKLMVQHGMQQQQQHQILDVNQQQQQMPPRPPSAMPSQQKMVGVQQQFVDPIYQNKIQQSPQQWVNNMTPQHPMRMDSVESVMSVGGMTSDDSINSLAVQPSYNQKSSERMKQDEVLGEMATISAVLYANTNHPELKIDFPNWTDRCKQILKKWRALSNERKSPFLQTARDNRSALRMKKAQQVPSPKDVSSNSSKSSTPVSSLPSSSPIMDMNHENSRGSQQMMVGHQQLQQGQVNSHQSQQQQLLVEDQDKISAQQKSLREQEQERQWKQLQAMRAREQQMQQLVLQDQRNQDPTMQLQIATSNNNFSIGPAASPSPNSRNAQFIAPATKGRIVGPSQSPTSFHHPNMPSRPVSVQIPRAGKLQQSLNSPFSPQSQTPLSPLDQGFPGSPANQNMDSFSRPSSENSQPDVYIQHSPQNSRSFGQQSPNQGTNRSPAYASQQPQQNQINPNQQPGLRLNIENAYAQAPGTPRPQFNSGTNRPTVYARPVEMFGNQPSPFTSPRNDLFPLPQQSSPVQSGPPQNQSDGNRQLRDLLQRQQIPTSNSPIIGNQLVVNQNTASSPSSRWTGNESDDANNVTQQIGPPSDSNTFRQPLPPGMILRPQRMPLQTSGGAIIRTNQIIGPNQIVQNSRLALTSDIRQRIIRPAGKLIQGQQLLAQHKPGQQQFVIQSGQRLPINITAINRPIQNEQQHFNAQQQIQNSQLMQQQQQQQQQQQHNLTNEQQNSTQFINQRIQRLEMENKEQARNIPSGNPGETQPSVPSGVDGESNEIPDNVTAELEKLEQEENSGIGEVEGVGDILGGLDEDDEDLLDSLTAEMGVDFNILEYADPELDNLNDGEKANLLDSLELDDGEPDKDVKKKESTDKNENTNVNLKSDGLKPVNNQPSSVVQQQQTPISVSETILKAGGNMLNAQSHIVVNRLQQQHPPKQQPQQHQQIVGGQHIIPQLANIQQQQQQQQQHSQPPQLILCGNQQEPPNPAQLNRIKALQQNQLHQQHLQQIQGQNIPIGTQIMTKDGVGIITGNNNNPGLPNILNRSTVQTLANHQQQQQRFQQIRLSNANIQNLNQGPRPRMIIQQQQQQQQHQNRMITMVQTGQQPQNQPQQQIQGQAAPPPPPPYPGPPPPYPGNIASNKPQFSYHSTTGGGLFSSEYAKSQRRPLLLQEQPLLLEDLLEQEKREQERQLVTSTSSHHELLQNVQQTSNQNLLNAEYDRMKLDVLNSVPHGLPAQGLLPLKQPQTIGLMQQQQQQQGGSGGIKPQQFLPRGINQQQWRGMAPNMQLSNQIAQPQQQQQQQQQQPQQVIQETINTGSRGMQTYNANLRSPPQLPPDNIITEQDRQIQVEYEKWLKEQNNVLNNQMKYYEGEVLRLRKIRKSLNSKQRQLKKTGNVLTEADASELTKITQEQTFYQKHLDGARKQMKQHSLLIQDYNTKQQSKMQQMQMINTGNSPAQMAPQSPMTIPPSSSQMLMQSSQSPLANPIQSPSPSMTAQSPGPANVNAIMQSPGNQSSPYNVMQASPRIGTPLLQNDENPFSPNHAPSVSPSIPNRLTSPAPRITSPQSRMGAPQGSIQGGRIITSPIMIQNVQQHQNRFVRPQSLNQEQNMRPRMSLGSVQQQRAHYNTSLGNAGPDHQRMLIVQQQRQRQLYQQQQQLLQQHHQQQQQQQQMQQQVQQQQQQQHQPQQQQTSSLHQQPPSPMHNQSMGPATSPMPRSPMIHYNSNQPPSPMIIQGSPLMRRPPSTTGSMNSPAGPDRPRSVESSPRNIFNPHEDNSGSGGGGNGSVAPVVADIFPNVKLGLRGGAPPPVWWGRNAKRLPEPSMSSMIKESQQLQQQEDERNENLKKDIQTGKIIPTKVGLKKANLTVLLAGGEQKKIQGHEHLDEIVVIDSSPDEKQRIMDYDDDNDKALVATEVSLSSVAQHGNEVDEITVIESFSTPPEFGDIVSSPLESSEVAEEYILFASDVVDYVDSDDSQKHSTKQQMSVSDDDKNIHLINLQSPGEDEHEHSSDDERNGKNGKEIVQYRDSPTGDHHYTAVQEGTITVGPEVVISSEGVGAKPANETNVATTEDFEAMIDCGNTKDGKGDSKKDNARKSASPPSTAATNVTISSEPKIITIITTQSGTIQTNKTNPIVTYAARIPISSAIMSNRSGMSTISLGTHKKLVKDGTQTTAKVSIGNQTISVPVLKSVPQQTGGNQSKSAPNDNSQMSKLSVTKSPNIINVGGQQKITTSSIITLSSYNFTQPRFVQNLGNSSQTTITPITVPTSESIIEKLSPKSSSSPSINYTKLSQLTVNQDVSLPTKIFEDESISPDSSIEHDDHDLLSMNDKPGDILASDKKVDFSEIDNQLELLSNETAIAELEKAKPSVIPMHVIIKSRESSSSPVLPVAQQQRLSSIMPQLSPLSQPTEMTTNMANVSQQLRTIMSSINSSTKTSAPTSSTKLIDSFSQKSQDTDNSSSSSSMKGETTPTILSSRPEDKAKEITMADQFLTQLTNPPSKIVTTSHILTQDRISPIISSAPTNILLLKQIRPIASSTNKQSSTSVANQPPQNQTLVFTTQQMPNLTKIQPPEVKTNIITITSTGTNVIIPNTSTLSSSPASQPPALIVTATRPGVISAITSGAHTKSATGGSILSATLSQPSTKLNTLLQSQFGSAPFRRSKSTDEVPMSIKEAPAQILGNKRHSLEASVAAVKMEPPETVASDEHSVTSSSASFIARSSSPFTIIKTETQLGGCKFSNITTTSKPEDSQNVLLKQLLQNSGATNVTTSSTPASISTRPVPGLRAPSLGVVSSLEAQLARPVIPPNPAGQLTSISSSVPVASTVQTTSNNDASPFTSISSSTTHRIMSRETSFVSKPFVNPLNQFSDISAQAVIQGPTKTEDATKKTIKLTTNVSLPPPPYPYTSTPTTVTVKQEPEVSFLNIMDVKKEIFDDNSPQSQNSDQGRGEKMELQTPKEECPDPMDSSKTIDAAIEKKRQKRREYQKNRRQMQILNKEHLTNVTKKKARKMSKIEEDYDTFIDNLMVQMRQLPSLEILEPMLNKNYGVCAPFGSGDFSKIYGTNFTTSGELVGDFGCAVLTNAADYNTKPFGSKTPPPPPPEQISGSTQRGFYDQEFPPLKLENEDERVKYDSMLKDRDVGTPDTIVSNSSPECTAWDSSGYFPGLRLIKEENMDDDDLVYKRMSPQIQIVTPIPIRLKTAGITLNADDNMEINHKQQHEEQIANLGMVETKVEPPATDDAVKENNITVTLTLTSSAAEDIMGVLKDLANILNIPQPSTYQIVERITTPPGQKLGLYRTKGKDGKEGVPIDIQTILNGAAKFCRHCDIVIFEQTNMIRAKSSDFPLLAIQSNEPEDLYFCGKNCYKQFQWRPTSILDDKSNKSLAEYSLPAITSARSPPIKNQNAMLKDILVEHETSTAVTTVSDSKGVRKHETSEVEDSSPPKKMHKGLRYKYFSPDCFQSPQHKYKKPTEREITELLFRMNVTVTPSAKIPEDTRKCIFCHAIGDGVADGPSRLLNYDVDKWVHLNCALWSDGVYETENGALMQLETALQVSLGQSCIFCNNLGATIKCFKPRCSNIYHLSCAMKNNCVFYKNKTIMCQSHAPRTEKDNELTTLSVERRVYVERDESRQVASVMHYSESSNLLRVGSLIFLNVGQLLPHQLATFHNQNFIYPIGYKIIRFYWSMRRPNKRCRYVCSIADISGRPEFRVLVQEPQEEDNEFRDSSARAVWQRILEPLAQLRKDKNLVRIFPKYVSGEDLFGLTEPAIVRILESLPGIETLTDYKFKYGRNPLLELPLAINPSGAARTEPKLKTAISWKKPHTQRTGSSSQRATHVPTTSIAGEVACPYSKQFVHSKSSQYKKMKQEWRNNVFLARSKIQGLGLYAARDLEKHTMVIEYIGEVIRTELSELREKQYEAKNRGIYMFRLDEDRVVDATLSGGLARYINHSCNPNCVTEIVEVDREYRIIIFAKRRITRGEEFSYDYKFDIEDDAHKIACMCGAPNCRKWMN